jgi:hypothetical protein
MSILRCSRCGDLSYELLTTYGYCANCNYSEDSFNDDNALATLMQACRQVDQEAKKLIPKERIVPVPLKDRSNRRFLEAFDERKENGAGAC